jgi:hypothetical protein
VKTPQRAITGWRKKAPTSKKQTLGAKVQTYFQALNGTTEVVPSQKPRESDFFQQPVKPSPFKSIHDPEFFRSLLKKDREGRREGLRK